MKDNTETWGRSLKRFGVATMSGLLVVGLTPTFAHIALADTPGTSAPGEKKTIEVTLQNGSAGSWVVPEHLKNKTDATVQVKKLQEDCPDMTPENGGQFSNTGSGTFKATLGFVASEPTNPAEEKTCAYKVTVKEPDNNPTKGVKYATPAFRVEWVYTPVSGGANKGSWDYFSQEFLFADQVESSNQPLQEKDAITFANSFEYAEVSFTKDNSETIQVQGKNKQYLYKGETLTNVPTSGQCQKQGDDFLGWLDNGKGTPLSNEQVKAPVMASHVYKASCAKTFEVTYQNDQGVQIGVARINPHQRNADPRDLKDGTKLSQKKLCSAGKIPSGKWVRVKKGGTPTNDASAQEFPDHIDADYTLKADCQPGVSVKFDANGGTFQDVAVKDVNHYSLDSQSKILTITYVEGTNLSAPQDGLVRLGHRLLGWSQTAGATQPDQGTLPANFPQESIEKPFYAVWEQDASGSTPPNPGVQPNNPGSATPGNPGTPAPGKPGNPSNPGSSSTPTPGTPTPDKPSSSRPSVSGPSYSFGGSSLGSKGTGKDKAEKDKQKQAEKEKTEKDKAEAKELAKKTAVTKFDQEFNTLVKLPAKAVQRAAGVNRVQTSLSALAQVKNREAVVLATGNDFPDALVGGAFAGALKAGVVLTTSDTIEPEIVSQLQAAGTKVVHVVGGYGAVSLAKEQALRAHGFTVVRHAGRDRYETAQMLKRATHEVLGVKSGVKAGVSCSATGSNFPDALACASAAALLGGTVDLVRPGSRVASDVQARSTVCAGGAACSVAGSGVTRVVGADRYETAYKVAQLAPASGRVLVSNGTSAADSLVAGALSASTGARLVLSNGKRVNVPEGTTSAHLIGGTAVLPDNLPMFTR